jgi:hypothetical protein
MAEAMLHPLILDIKIVIATKLARLPYPEDVKIWNALMYDEEFANYVRSNDGIKLYVKSFVKELRCYLTLSPKPFILNKVITNSIIAQPCEGKLPQEGIFKPEIVAGILFGNTSIWPCSGFIHTKDGVLHNDFDSPAINISGKYIVWIKDGDVHRDSIGPAVITPASLQWYKYCALHQIDEPASISLRNGKGVEWTWWRNAIYQLGENEDGTEMKGLPYLHRHRSYRIEAPGFTNT